ATQLLGDLGAEVLKIEDPWQGDYMRWMPPHLPGTRESRLCWGLNRNKQSMTLNLKSPAGRANFLRLVEKDDVGVEGVRTGVMAGLGLGYENLKAVNPRLIMVSISGYGQDGPYRDRAGHDLNYIALAGILELTGEAPDRPPGDPPGPAGRPGRGCLAGGGRHPGCLPGPGKDGTRAVRGRFHAGRFGIPDDHGLPG